jgi:Domain of unknown function (DUF4173)
LDRHRTALTIGAAALALGLAWNILMRYIPWGVNALIWTALFIGATLFCGKRPLLFPALCALGAAAGLLWRDADTLVMLDLLLLAVFLPMLALDARGVRLRSAGIVEVGAAVAFTGMQAAVGLPQLIGQDLSWSQLPRGSARGAGVAVRGTIIALPALIVFGILLAAADPEFGRILREVGFFDFRQLFEHLLVIAVIGAICAGFLRAFVLSGAMPRVTRPSFLRLPAAEVTFALGLVNALFALFVALQFRYFFGAAPSNLSDYARRGFFELVWVIALVVPMLLLLEWLVDKERGLGMFRVMAVAQVALVFAIAFSAYHRMALYRDEFGLTRLRFYTTAFMLWVAVLLVWLVLTVLTGHRERFAIGVLTTAVIAVAILHAINPDALIVRTNLARAETGRRSLDERYTTSLSADAAGVILDNPAFPQHVALQYAQQMKRETIGWRTWNLSRARAIELARPYPTLPKRPYRWLGD